MGRYSKVLHLVYCMYIFIDSNLQATVWQNIKIEIMIKIEIKIKVELLCPWIKGGKKPPFLIHIITRIIRLTK